MRMLNDMNERGSMPSKSGERRAYGPPSLIVHGRMAELTEAGNGNGKESGTDSKRPMTLSNP